MTDPPPAPEHPPLPAGGFASCVTGRKLPLVARCEFFCCRCFTCPDCGADVWDRAELAPLTVPREKTT